MKILVIDDDPLIINAISCNFKNYQVIGCTSSREGIKKLKSEPFDLLVLDYFVDAMNGKDIVEEIRKFNTEIYIALLTGQSQKAPGMKMLKDLDVQSYIEKTPDFEKVLIGIESAVKSVLHMYKGDSSFPERLKELRKARGISQDDLAKYLGVTRTTVTSYEAGTSEPNIQTIRRIASFFSVSIDYLLCYANVKEFNIK